MTTNQPNWKCVANLGDATPNVYGGAFVLVDQTGVYPPELEVWEPMDDDPKVWEKARIVCEPCTYQSGILSDNPYHSVFPAWFAGEGDLQQVAETCDVRELDLILLLCSDDPIKRAQGYYTLYNYWGGTEMTGGYAEVWKPKRGEIARRMHKYLKQLARERGLIQ